MKKSLPNFLKISLLLITLIVSPIISKAQWSAPLNISPAATSATMNESMGTCIGVSGDTLHVVWCDKHTPTHSAIYYSRSIDTGLTWSAPINITDTSSNDWNPTIAVNGSNVHVAWRYINPANNRRASYYKHSTDGGNTWGPLVFLDSTADWPAISVSGNNVYIANDRVVSQSPYNTEIFFMHSVDNGTTWSAAQRLTFAVGRSEDEAISAQGSHIHMSWNDNRSGLFQILYKESADYGATWDSDLVVVPIKDYNTMVSIDGAHVDVIAAGAPSGHYQVQLAQSADTGATWATNIDLSNDTSHTYFLPDMVRNGNDLHVISNSSAGAKYFHSADGGTTWDAPFTLPGCTFIAYTGCALHIVYVHTSHIYYLRNPTGNAGHCNSVSVGIPNNYNVESDVTIAPNPFSTSTTIYFRETQKHVSLKITDILGNELKTFLLNNTSNFTIDKGTMLPGVYFVQITDGMRNFICHKKVIIN